MFSDPLTLGLKIKVALPGISQGYQLGGFYSYNWVDVSYSNNDFLVLWFKIQ